MIAPASTRRPDRALAPPSSPNIHVGPGTAKDHVPKCSAFASSALPSVSRQCQVRDRVDLPFSRSPPAPRTRSERGARLPRRGCTSLGLGGGSEGLGEHTHCARDRGEESLPPSSRAPAGRPGREGAFWLQAFMTQWLDGRWCAALGCGGAARPPRRPAQRLVSAFVVCTEHTQVACADGAASPGPAEKWRAAQ